jgi:Domain of unknown function (DUF4268)
MTELGRLEPVDLGTIWADEAQNFTPWLAKEANLKILGETIGIVLDLEAQERNVGPFRADILCKDTYDGSWVLIENQLKRTDHAHLGQLLTYAAGLHAVTIVWIAARFTEEHRATVDWLNEITGDQFRFFGLEIELWRIGSSPAAPKFNVVAKPNDWTQSVGQAARQISSEPLSETQAQQQAYWAALRELLLERGSDVRLRKPLPQHWIWFGIGRTEFSLLATTDHRTNRWIRVGLRIQGRSAEAFFHLLHAERPAIEQAVGAPLYWEPLETGFRISLSKEEVDPSDESDWPNQHEWLADKLELFDRVFRPRIKQLNAADWIPEPEPGGEETPGAA